MMGCRGIEGHDPAEGGGSPADVPTAERPPRLGHGLCDLALDHPRLIEDQLRLRRSPASA